jgi:hypothetical protein
VDKRVVASIALGAKPHGQGPSSTGDRVYVTTDGGPGEVIALDTRKRTILWQLVAGDALNEPHLTRDDRFLFAPDLLNRRELLARSLLHTPPRARRCSLFTILTPPTTGAACT